MRKVTKVEQPTSGIMKRKRVAAYCRVSKDSEDSLHSLSAQVSYYNSLIQSNPEWEFVGVYFDEGISGTGTRKREEFQRLLMDAEEGKIDIILTKSISRFARNTVDLLETIRRLKSIGVEVRFERECINSMSGDGELMLTILASFAQAEAEATSQNIKWSIKKGFEQGRAHNFHPTLGYRWNKEKGQLVIVPEEADLVRRIFEMYRDGNSLSQITDALNSEGIKPMKADKYHETTISRILDNDIYTGNTLMQKYYVRDPVEGKLKKNRGELPKYYMEDSHEAIIDMTLFEAVQERKKLMQQVLGSEHYEVRAFSRKIICGNCGRKYMRTTSSNNGHTYYYWKCWLQKDSGRKACSSRCLREDRLEELFCRLLNMDVFDKATFREEVDKILVYEDCLEISYSDGRVEEVRDAKCKSNTCNNK